MNIQRKSVKMNINGKEYDAIIDFKAAIDFEMRTKKSMIKEIEELGKTQSIVTIANIMASIIKDENNNSIGLDAILDLDLVDGASYFMEKIYELVDSSLPVATEEDKKK